MNRPELRPLQTYNTAKTMHAREVQVYVPTWQEKLYSEVCSQRKGLTWLCLSTH